MTIWLLVGSALGLLAILTLMGLCFTHPNSPYFHRYAVAMVLLAFAFVIWGPSIIVLR